jgi:hypothetical protein
MFSVDLAQRMMHELHAIRRNYRLLSILLIKVIISDFERMEFAHEHILPIRPTQIKHSASAIVGTDSYVLVYLGNPERHS